jgi:hypothetical protein
MPSSQVVKLWVEQPAKTIFANTSSDATVERDPLILLIWYCVVRIGAVYSEPPKTNDILDR